MKVNIRPFTIGDYEAVINLWKQADLPIRLQGRDSQEEINKQINNGITLFFIAELEGKIVGTVLGTHDGRKGWINRLAVNSNFRRQGIANRLVKDLEAKFEDLGLEVTACLIEQENTISMEFFKSLGYDEWTGKYFSKRKRLES